MLQYSFNLIHQHFSSNCLIKKNIFLTKDYDYPNHFIQKLYLSYLQLQQTLNTSSTQQIVKKINFVSNKNDSALEGTILAIVYGIVLNTGNCRLQGSKTIDFQKQVQKKKSSQLLDQKQDLIKFSEQMIKQIKEILPLFRAEAWSLFNSVTSTLIMNHFHQIKPVFKFGLIALFDCMQQFESCSDNLFILMIKTLSFYDQSTLSIKYNLLLLQHLSEILKSSQQESRQPERLMIDIKEIQIMQVQRVSHLKTKKDQQISLMRLYLFVKLVHFQYLAHKLKAFMKGEWPFYLQKLFLVGSNILKRLFSTNPDECLVFSAQLSKYTSYSVSDPQLEEIFQRIRSSQLIKVQLLSHHYSLVPLSIQMMIPFQLEQSLNRLECIMTQSDQGQEARVEKSSIFMSLGWVWKEMSNTFSGELNKSYLLENVLPDLVRWAVTANGRNMHFKIILVQWAMYQCPQNQTINKSLKYAFFQDVFYYIKNSHQIDLQTIFPILSVPFYILNFLSFYSPHVAQQLFLTIFNRLSIQIFDRQPISITEELLRQHLNHVLFKANIQGLIRINEIIYHSHLGNYIKNQLELRIQQAELNRKNQSVQNNQIQSFPQKQPLQKSKFDNKTLSSKPQIQYYGIKNTNIEFNLNRIESGNPSQEEQDLIYTSHQLIPSSPSQEHMKDPHLLNLSSPQKDLKTTNQNQSQSFKRQNQISTYQLQKQLQNKQFELNKWKFSQQSLQLDTKKQNKKDERQDLSEIHLQKEFYEQMGNEVNFLLNGPSVIQFTEYMKQLTKSLKDYKKSGQQEQIIETFLQETSKILYLAFNHQFQSFNLTDEDPHNPKQSRLLTYFLLKSIHQHWKHSLSIYQVLIYKKIVKTLIESFPSCQFAFYLTFLDIFKKGLPHFRQMKAWLIQKQRQKYVVPVLQKILGKKFKIHLYQNAQALKIQ